MPGRLRLPALGTLDHKGCRQSGFPGEWDLPGGFAVFLWPILFAEILGGPSITEGPWRNSAVR
jgi:hypothetical protein